jgi:hypothetical protein
MFLQLAQQDIGQLPYASQAAAFASEGIRRHLGSADDHHEQVIRADQQYADAP